MVSIENQIKNFKKQQKVPVAKLWKKIELYILHHVNVTLHLSISS